MTLYDTLLERDLVAQCTDDSIRERLSESLSCYIGFDPTADSLHIGSLVPVMGLYHLQQAGHRPLVLVGGGTALIGDPSGKTEARQMLTREQIDINAQAIGNQLRPFLDFDNEKNGALLLNNADWLCEMSWVDILREAGPHFSVNRMLTMDSVKGRMDSGGITFLEFNYMVMQAWDFYYLNKTHGCTLQMGGQDQWGNIVMGMELTRRKSGAHVAGLTMPLVTKADGGKFGKSEKGNIWLDPQRTPHFEFYQFWRNVADADVIRFLKFFTTLPMSDIDRLATLEGQALNEAKEVLAHEVTKLVRGEEAALSAQADARKAFGAKNDVTGDNIPHENIAGSELEEGLGLLSLLVRAGLAKSNGEARRLVQGRGVRIHDTVVDDPSARVTSADINDSFVLIRCGKKRMYRFDVQA